MLMVRIFLLYLGGLFLLVVLNVSYKNRYVYYKYMYNLFWNCLYFCGI